MKIRQPGQLLLPWLRRIELLRSCFKSALRLRQRGFRVCQNPGGIVIERQLVAGAQHEIERGAARRIVVALMEAQRVFEPGEMRFEGVSSDGSRAS